MGRTRWRCTRCARRCTLTLTLTLTPTLTLTLTPTLTLTLTLTRTLTLTLTLPNPNSKGAHTWHTMEPTRASSRNTRRTAVSELSLEQADAEIDDE